MTLDEFVIECNERGISPNVALENDVVKAAIIYEDADMILDALDTEF